jgi:hypothetical protein
MIFVGVEESDINVFYLLDWIKRMFAILPRIAVLDCNPTEVNLHPGGELGIIGGCSTWTKILRYLSLSGVETLAVRIRNFKQPRRTIGLSTPTWREILKLALSYGWLPLGSVPPEVSSMDFGPSGFSSYNWDDEATWQEADTVAYHPSTMLISYLPFFFENGQAQSKASRLVLLEDALNFADALDRAYQAYEPLRVPASFFLFEPDDPVFSQRPSLGALAAALEVCREGSFSIEPWRF